MIFITAITIDADVCSSRVNSGGLFKENNERDVQNMLVKQAQCGSHPHTSETPVLSHHTSS